MKKVTRSRRDQHGVDDVHDAVGAVHIGGGHLGNTVDDDVAASDLNFDLSSFESLNFLLRFQVGGMDGAGDDMVFEHSLKLLDVLGVEQVVKGRLGQLGESLVGGREDGERARGGKGGHKLSGFEGRDERGEVRNTLSGRDDILSRGLDSRKSIQRLSLDRDGFELKLLNVLGNLLRDQDLVDDVHDAVGRQVISLENMRVVDFDVSAESLDFKVRAFEGLDLLLRFQVG